MSTIGFHVVSELMCQDGRLGSLIYRSEIISRDWRLYGLFRAFLMSDLLPCRPKLNGRVMSGWKVRMSLGLSGSIWILSLLLILVGLCRKSHRQRRRIKRLPR